MAGAEADPGPDDITFDIAGPGPHTIAVTELLPTLTQPTTIDGRTQPGFVGLPMIEIVPGADVVGGLVAQAPDVTVASCLGVRGFSVANLIVVGDRADRPRTTSAPDPPGPKRRPGRPALRRHRHPPRSDRGQRRRRRDAHRPLPRGQLVRRARRTPWA